METPYAWCRLAAAVALSTIGGVGLWSIVVALPAVQADFGVVRAGAALPYALITIGVVLGSVLAGRLVDRFGIMMPVVGGTIMLSVGYMATAHAPDITVFAIICGVLIGMLGTAVVSAPLIADTSLWFDRRRGLAIALCASGNYFAGTIWPPVIEHFITTNGWRQTHLFIGLIFLVTMLPLTLVLRRPAPPQAPAATDAGASRALRPGLL